MSSESRKAKAAEIWRPLAEEGASVAENTRGFNDGRYESIAELDDYEELKGRARAIKEDAIERLPELIEAVRESVEANGGTVYLADERLVVASGTSCLEQLDSLLGRPTRHPVELLDSGYEDGNGVNRRRRNTYRNRGGFNCQRPTRSREERHG
jgi:chorismate synthase